MDFEIKTTQTVHLAKVWKRIKISGKVELGWSSQGVQAFVIDDPTPQTIASGDAFINDCKTNNEAGDIIISRGGMGRAKRVKVRLLSQNEFVDAVRNGTVV